MTTLGSQGIGKFRSTCQDLWLLSKQAWYVPFLWSLAWFSYWIFHDAIVLKQVTQGTPSDLLGVSISISALLFAGYISGKSVTKIVVEKATGVVAVVNKKFSFRKSLGDEKDTRILPQEIHQEVRSLSSLHHEIGWDEPTEIGPGQEFYEKPDEPNEARKIQEISSDCLVCPNLLSCNERQDRGVELVTRCPLAK